MMMQLSNVFEHFNGIRYHSFTFTTGSWNIISDFSNITVLYQPFPFLDDGFMMFSTETEISNFHIATFRDRNKICVTTGFNMLCYVHRNWTSGLVQWIAVNILT